MIGIRLTHTIAAATVALSTVTAVGVSEASAAEDLPAKFLQDDVMIREAPRLHAVALGQGELDHSVTAHCIALGDTVEGSRMWILLTDNTTGVRGYTVSRYVGVKATIVNC